MVVVAAADAGSLGIPAHAALQCVGRPSDRFFFLDYQAGRASSPATSPGGRQGGIRVKASRVVLSELPTILAARASGARETFQELASSRRLARHRLSDPGLLMLDGPRRTIRIDDAEFSLPRLQFFWFFTLATLAPAAFPLKAMTGNVDTDLRGRLETSRSSSGST